MLTFQLLTYLSCKVLKAERPEGDSAKIEGIDG